MKPGNAVAIALCMAVAVLEGFDIQAMGVAMPRLGPEFGLDSDAKGWLFSVNNIGMVLGAAVGGWLADRTGRRPVLLCGNRCNSLVIHHENRSALHMRRNACE